MTSDDDVLEVAPGCRIRRSELRWRFGPSGGPGGQHANRAHTRVDVSFDVAASTSLTPAQRDRLLERLGPVVVASADDERSQLRNRALAESRLRRRLADALRTTTPRRPSRPSRAAVERRLREKRARGQRKADRRRPPDGDSA